MDVSDDEIMNLRQFINGLNSTKSVVVVEGKRDSAALKKLGFTQEILEFHRFGGIAKFADLVSNHKNLIVLFDSDKKGRYLTRRIIEQLQHRTKIDLTHKKKLMQITCGKIRAIEELSRYEQYLEQKFI
jgi:5S rRNA maturation endonuclease (ribonuclease M5)